MKKENYWEMADIRLPRPERLQATNKLYLVEVLGRDNGRVKIHYVGYSDVHVEWRDEEIAPFGVQDALQMEPYRPYFHYRELAYAIKAALRSALPRQDPDVRIKIPFNQLVYNGGLKASWDFCWRMVAYSCIE